MKDVWLWLTTEDMQTELRQAEDEGKDLTGLETEIDELTMKGADSDERYQVRISSMLDRIAGLPLREGYPYIEPNEIEAIRAERPDRRGDSINLNELVLAQSDAVIGDRIHGAWLGRCAGCLLGKPIEGIKFPRLRNMVASVGKDRITDYLWRMNPTPEACEAAGKRGLLSFGAEIEYMPRDDDTDYTIMGMSIVNAHGIDFTSDDVAATWMKTMPLLSACTAERVAYRNFAL